MRWLIIIPATLVALIVGISFYLQPNDFIGCGEKPLVGSVTCEPVDAIVVVSGGDTNARTDEGVKLVQSGWAKSIVFSGAAQDKTSISNAAAMRLRAIDRGLSPSAIYVEEYSENTAQNAQNTGTIFKENGFKTIILVTSGYHQRRADLEFKKSNQDVLVLNHPLLFDKDWSYFWWLTPKGWWLTGGELVKITAFYIEGASS
jgi:uncharacterized SAM-binding protein YcdF (DUF218 family)